VTHGRPCSFSLSIASARRRIARASM
jgi:hypothetical protein